MFSFQHLIKNIFKSYFNIEIEKKNLLHFKSVHCDYNPQCYMQTNPFAFLPLIATNNIFNLNCISILKKIIEK